MNDRKFCHEPIKQGHYCHKPAGHAVNKDPHSLSAHERALSAHVCNCKGLPSLEATKPGE